MSGFHLVFHGNESLFEKTILVYPIQSMYDLYVSIHLVDFYGKCR